MARGLAAVAGVVGVSPSSKSDLEDGETTALSCAVYQM